MSRKFGAIALLLAAISSATALAQSEDVKRTMGMSNGRMWAEMDGPGRLYYVWGLSDAAQLFAQPGDAERLRCNCTYGEVIDGITRLYAMDPTYSTVPIVVMLRLHVERAKGATKEDVQREITTFLKGLAGPR